MKKEQLLVAYNNMQTCGFDNLNAAELWQYHKLHKELAGIQKDFSTDELALVEKYKIQYNPAIKQFFTTSENKDDLKTFTEVREAALTEEIPVSVKPFLTWDTFTQWVKINKITADKLDDMAELLAIAPNPDIPPKVPESNKTNTLN